MPGGDGRAEMQGEGGPERLKHVQDAALPVDALEIMDPTDGTGGGLPYAPEPVRAVPTHDDDLEPSAATTFGEFYRTTYADMVRLAFLLTGSTETARDLVQDSYLRVHGAWDRVSEPRPYLRRAEIGRAHV